jgi:hypothetical protein
MALKRARGKSVVKSSGRKNFAPVFGIKNFLLVGLRRFIARH